MTLMADYPLVPSLSGNELFLITDPNTSDPANNVLTSVLANYVSSSIDCVTTLQNVGNLGQGFAKAVISNVGQFYNLAPSSSKISLSLDSVNNNILIDVVQSNININSLSGGPLSIANGGTNASNSILALANLGGLASNGTISLSGNWPAGNFFAQFNGVTVGNSLNQISGLSSIINGSATLTLPTTTDTMIGRATTDTLTNKSMSGSSNTFTNLPSTAITGILGIANGGTNLGSYTTGSIIFYDGASLNQNNSKLFWDNTNISLGIGGIPSSSATLDIVNNSGSVRALQMTSYGANNGFRSRYANGTLLSPTAATSGNIVSFISGRGYGTTGFASASTGAVNIIAGGTFTDTSMPTYLAFNVTPTASITSAEAMRINTTSNVLIGTTTDNSTDKLQVSGNVNSSADIISGTAGSGFVELQTQSSNPSIGASNSVRLYSNSSGQFSWRKQTDGFNRSFNSTLTADRVYTLQDSSDTFVMRSTTDTLTNKTISGSSNTITNVSLTTGVTGTLPVVNGGTGVTTSTGTGSVVLSNTPTLVTPTIGVATSTSISNGDGSATAPSFTFTSDNDNGFYRVAENRLGVTVAGSQIAEFNPTGFSLQSNYINKITETTITSASTATGAQLFGGLIACTSGGGFTLTLDTAANIYAAMGSPAYIGASFICRIVANGGANVTIATNTGLTLVLGSTNVTNDMRQYVFVVTNTSTPTITVYGG